MRIVALTINEINELTEGHFYQNFLPEDGKLGYVFAPAFPDAFFLFTFLAKILESNTAGFRLYSANQL